MAPPPRKPTPETTWAAIRVGSESGPVNAWALTMVKIADPSETNAWVRNPAGMRCSSRSHPITAPSRSATTRRSVSSICVPRVRSSTSTQVLLGCIGRNELRPRGGRPRVDCSARHDQAEPDRHEAYQQEARRDVEPATGCQLRPDRRPQDAEQQAPDAQK